ncbi:MAG TPA: ATP-binding protein [Longimicrobiaceae bacterium]|nr:ATP-binding protein [Longimicrobiaceae bacterium]
MTRPPAPPPRPQLPAPRRTLAWLDAGRVSVALAIFLAAAWNWREIEPGVRIAVVLVLAATGAFTAASLWSSQLRRREPSTTTRYAQLVFDALLVTAVVHLTGSSESAFAPLYILVICAAALLLPLAGTLLVGALVSVLYLADVMLVGDAITAGVLIQLGLFALVALLTGYLGDRVRQTGTALGEAQTALRLLRLDTDEILASINTGILTVDGLGRLAYMNPAASELLSLAPSQWVGQPILGLLDSVAPGMGSVIARTAEGRRPVARFETDEVRDSAFVFGVSTTVMERPDGSTPPVTAIFQDITGSKRIEALRRRAERLEAVAELSASLAHEIKNPLASIRSAVEQLAGGRVDADDAKLLEGLVVRESSRLSRLLEDFIDFARVRAADPEPFDLVPLVGRALEVVRAHPDARGRQIDFSPPAGKAPLELYGSADLLHRAVLNLLLNSVQWAGDGGRVRIELDVIESDLLSLATGAARAVRLAVADSGPGVSSELAERIFEPFFTLRIGGSGLGLPLVQRAAEAHGGAVEVAPTSAGTDSRGATFVLYLPLGGAPSAPAGIPDSESFDP